MILASAIGLALWCYSILPFVYDRLLA